MDQSTQQFQPREGATVYGADGDKVGKIIATGPQYVVVEKGFFFPTDYFIPTSAIANSDGDNVYLSVTKDDALNSGWDQEPTGYTYASGTTTTGAYTGDTMATGSVAENAAYDDTVLGTEMADRSFQRTGETSRLDTDETLRIPVHEEELIAQKRQVERGQVRVEKDVTAQEQVLEVPVTEERVRVTRHAVDRDVTGADVDANAFEDTVIDVPVEGEEVQLGKRVRVAEEVEIGKEKVQRTERVAGTVRREEVRVDESAQVLDRDRGATDSAR